MKAFLQISIGESKPSTLKLNLDSDTVPRTVLNFTTLLSRKAPNGYLQSKFHRLIPSFMIQGGDFTNGDGTGGTSIYGDEFNDENFTLGHDRRGALSMANSGRDTNGSQFYITFRNTAHLDGKHVVFGHVDMEDEESVRLLNRLEGLNVGKGDVPSLDVLMVGGGIVKKQEAPSEAVVKEQVEVALDNQDEIDLEDDDEEDAEEEGVKDDETEEPNGAEDDADAPPLDASAAAINPNSKKAKLQERLLKLKMKMNQSRQLNKKEVLSEGERFGSKEAQSQYRKQTSKQDKFRKEQEYNQVHAKSKISAELSKQQKKAMMQSGDESLHQAMKKEAMTEKTMFSFKDFHNPEGQFRNYENTVKSLRTENLDTSYKNPDEISTDQDRLRERDGAKRLAVELKRRAAKSEKRKQKEVEFEGEDVTYINKRNKAFNERISKDYDKHTAEIRQNLERGTAL